MRDCEATISQKFAKHGASCFTPHVLLTSSSSSIQVVDTGGLGRDSVFAPNV
jgi:hypothetical protein